MKKNLKLTLLAALFLGFCTTAGFADDGIAVSDSRPANKLNADIEKIIAQSRIKKENLGVVIGYSGEAIDRVYDLNGQKLMIPASLTKVVTAGAVLEKMPVGHQFVTALASAAKIQDKRLDGDLYLRGGGDAGFVSESMWFMVNEFMRNDITEIIGDIVVDDTWFDAIRFDAGRDDARVDRAYDAPIGAMTFNWSSANIFVRPTQVGQAPKVFIDPINDYLKLDNKARVVKGSRNSLAVSRVGSVENGTEKIMVSGEIGIDSPEVVNYKSISDPALWAGYHLKEFLRQRGIEVKGKVRLGKTPDKVKVLAQVKSKPITQHVADMMKFSNNYVAEILTKNLAVHVHGQPGTMEKGVGQLKEYLQAMGIKEFEITSPSGLSRRNKMRAEDIFKVLSHLKRNFRIFPEYLSSLPIMGVDGTLRRRMSTSGTMAQVRAKTGHLTGVTGLAGYLGKTDEKQLTFVFLYNGGVAESAKAKDLFDRIIVRLLE